jgi:hypothetical protein
MRTPAYLSSVTTGGLLRREKAIGVPDRPIREWALHRPNLESRTVTLHLHSPSNPPQQTTGRG